MTATPRNAREVRPKWKKPAATSLALPAKNTLSERITLPSHSFPDHLHEILSQLKGEEKHTVDPGILEKVRAEARKYRIEVESITMSQVRSILQRLKLSKYYDHTAQIVAILSGKPPIVIPPEIEKRIKQMFNEAMPVYENYKGKRKNFLSYTFVILKILEIIDHAELVQQGRQMKVLKSKSKIREQDQIWRKMCEELNWPYFETRL